MADPIEVSGVFGKLQNGLYLRRIALYADRIAFEVFTSRPLGTSDLDGLTLSDSTETVYSMTPLRDAIDGHGEIEFTPAPPRLLTVRLSGRGWGLFTYSTDPLPSDARETSDAAASRPSAGG